MAQNSTANLSASLRAAARKYCNRPAVIGGNRVLTHGQLDEAAMNLARRFLAEGLVSGDRVAIHGPNTTEVVVAFLACFHAGLIAVPVNTRFKPPEIRYILDHSRPRVVYCDPQFAAGMEVWQSEISGLSTIYKELPNGLSGSPLPIPTDETPALILYTSGTTARPKGVTHTQQTLHESAQTMFSTGIAETSVSLAAMSLMHTSALCGTLLPTLIQGGSVVLLPKPDAATLLDLAEAHRCTWTLVLPALLQFVATEQKRQPRNISSIRTWLCGGDSVPVTLQQRIQELCGQPVIEGYAMSESLLISANPVQANRPGSIGLPATGIEIRLRDDEGNAVPDGAIGEITVRSPANFVGYWNDPDSTARTIADGWLRTGDRARFDQDGYLWFEGRTKEIIIRGGSNIAPREVEEALYQHASVLEAGVVGIPDGILGERVVAFVALREGCSVAETELRAFSNQQLADYKVPESIFFLPQLPKGLTGKVQRRALKELAREHFAA
jgi:long-chain acyl-CoA synthetase